MKKFTQMIMSATITATLFLTMLTGCTNSNNGDTNNVTNTNSSSASGGNSTTSTSSKDTIRLPLGSEIDSLDPLNSAAADTSAIMMNVFEGLLGFSEKGEFIPALAESYEVSEDGLQYTFHLKEGVKFHNGEDFTSKDVIYTYNQLAGFEGYEATSNSVKGALESIEAPDDYTVIMNLYNLDSSFLTKCINLIVQDGYGKDDTAPIGTGPYKFVEYVHGEKITFEIYDDYNTTDKIPTVQNIEVSIMTDANAILLALKTGQLDIATVLANDMQSLDGEYNLYEFPQNMVQILALNNSVDGLDNPDVRRAIDLAIDKQEIIDLSTFGAGTITDTFISPVMDVYYNDDLVTNEQDLELARTLLKEAGYEDLTFTCRAPSNYQTHVDTAQVIKDQLSKIGVTMEIELIEWATWLEDVYGNANYEATVCAHTGKLDPMDFLIRFTSTYGRNYYKFSNDRYDEVINLATSSIETSDLIKYYNEAQQILVDESAAIFIQDPSLLYATTKDIGGILNYPYRFIDFASFKIL